MIRRTLRIRKAEDGYNRRTTEDVYLDYGESATDLVDRPRRLMSSGYVVRMKE